MKKIFKTLKFAKVEIIGSRIKIPKYLFSTPFHEYIPLINKNIKKIRNRIKFNKKYFVHKQAKNDDEAYEQEKEKHAEIAKQAKLGILEIGILNGETSKVLASSNPRVPVYGIDPIIIDSMSNSMIGNREKIEENTGGLTNFHFVKDYSYNVSPKWNKPLDYIFIDGDHLYDAVKQDFEEWFPKLEAGGIISFHDSTMNRGGLNYWAGPSKLADELIFDDRLEFLESIGRLTIFKKKKQRL